MVTRNLLRRLFYIGAFALIYCAKYYWLPRRGIEVTDLDTGIWVAVATFAFFWSPILSLFSEITVGGITLKQRVAKLENYRRRFQILDMQGAILSSTFCSGELLICSPIVDPKTKSIVEWQVRFGAKPIFFELRALSEATAYCAKATDNSGLNFRIASAGSIMGDESDVSAKFIFEAYFGA